MKVSSSGFCSGCGISGQPTVHITDLTNGFETLIEVRLCKKCLNKASKHLDGATEKSGGLWKLLGEEGSSITYGMNVPQGVIVRIDVMDTIKKKCLASSTTIVPFSTVVPKDQNLYHIISTVEGELTRIGDAMASTFDKSLRKHGR